MYTQLNTEQERKMKEEKIKKEKAKLCEKLLLYIDKLNSNRRITKTECKIYNKKRK